MNETYIVTGFLRSGTSMMMSALAAGGLDAARDESSNSMNEHYGYDGYVPNDEYWELPREAIREYDFPRAYTGMLIKTMTPRVPFLAPMPGGYRVVIMRRHPDEIRKSLGEIMKRMKVPEEHGGQGERFIDHNVNLQRPDFEDWLDTDYERNMDFLVEHLENRRDVLSITVLEYKQVVESPHLAFSMLVRDGWDIDVDAAVAQVDPDLRRSKVTLTETR